ncbi:MAG: hypothetical protein ACRENM_01015 [Candidatus Dormibacteraceae bacterium]
MNGARGGVRLFAVLLVLVGLIWIGQGVGVIKGSFMTGQSRWAVIGAIAVLLGLAVGALSWRRSRP